MDIKQFEEMIRSKADSDFANATFELYSARKSRKGNLVQRYELCYRTSCPSAYGGYAFFYSYFGEVVINHNGQVVHHTMSYHYDEYAY